MSMVVVVLVMLFLILGIVGAIMLGSLFLNWRLSLIIGIFWFTAAAYTLLIWFWPWQVCIATVVMGVAVILWLYQWRRSAPRMPL